MLPFLEFEEFGSQIKLNVFDMAVKWISKHPEAVDWEFMKKNTTGWEAYVEGIKRFDPKKVEEEKASTRTAARALGYTDLRFHDLRDELLDERLLDVILPLEQCVREVKPSVVYTHHRGDNNQDHRALFHASEACTVYVVMVDPTGHAQPLSPATGIEVVPGRLTVVAP